MREKSGIVNEQLGEWVIEEEALKRLPNSAQGNALV